MAGKLLTAAVALSLVVLGGVAAWYWYTLPTLPAYVVSLHNSNSTAIGHVAIDGRSYDINYQWFNSSLRAYGNYTISFPNDVEYNGVSNTTMHLYLVRNTTVAFTFSSTGTKGPIYL